MNKAILLSVIVIAILFVVNIFLFYQNQNLKQEILVLNSRISELEKQKPESVAEKPPEGWKEYVDKEYGFRIWYPEEFTYYARTEKTYVYRFTDKDPKVIYISTPVLDDAPLTLTDIYIYIYI